MNRLLISYLPLVLLGGMLGLTIFYLVSFRKNAQFANDRMFFSAQLPRAPGQSLLNRLGQFDRRILKHASYLFWLPALIYAVFVLQRYGANQNPSVDLVIVGLIFIALITFFYLKLTPILFEHQSTRLQYVGDVVVAQALNRLMVDGHRVYHDLPADHFTIAHIIVGNFGIFAVETLARQKPSAPRRTGSPMVEYDGRALHFPDTTDSKIIELAEKKAEWLSDWLSGVVGETLAARAVVVIPGWLIKRTSSDGIPVVNPNQFRSLFKHIQPRLLERRVIERILEQLEQHCCNGDIR